MLFELDARIAGLADFQMAADLLFGHALELTVQILKESGTGLVAGDHRDGGFTGRATAAGRSRSAGPTVPAGAAEQPLQGIEKRH